jgi:hypothetical protein
MLNTNSYCCLSLLAVDSQSPCVREVQVVRSELTISARKGARLL